MKREIWKSGWLLSSNTMKWALVTMLAGVPFVTTGCVLPSAFEEPFAEQDTAVDTDDVLTDLDAHEDGTDTPLVDTLGSDTTARDTGPDTAARDTVPDTPLDTVEDSSDTSPDIPAPVCDPGTADCDDDPSNGCETELTSDTNCGVCGQECATGETCGQLGCGPAFVQLDTGYRHTCGVTATGEVYCWGSNDQGQLGGIPGPAHMEPRLVDGIEDAALVSTGFKHTCAVTHAGDAWCWGSDSSGQLGDGTGEQQPVPTRVTTENGPLTEVVFVDASLNPSSWAHTCALLSSGAVYCWGGNNRGQVDATSTRTMPFATAAYPEVLTSVEHLSVGLAHTCAIQSGVVLCWGEPANGRTGQVGALTGFGMTFAEGDATAVAAGGAHTCAVVQGPNSSQVHCWGANVSSVLGYGSSEPIDSGTAVEVIVEGTLFPVQDAKDVRAGEHHVCITHNDDSVSCWGNNERGQLGSGDRVIVPKATKVVSGAVADLALGYRTTCALAPDGEALCWGDNGDGQLGLGWASSARQPADVTLPGNPIRISAGAQHTCAIVENNGGLHCWGRNDFGQLGDGTQEERRAPVPVQGMEMATAVAAGMFHTCALMEGNVYCWGQNDAKRLLGSDTVSSQSTPYLVPLDDSLHGMMTEIVVGGTFSMAKDHQATWWSWGQNLYGQAAQIPPGATSVAPSATMITMMSHPALGSISGCGKVNNRVHCWGDNDLGQVGDSDGGAIPSPVGGLPTTTSLLRDLSSGIAHVCAGYASEVDGGIVEAWCWGWNVNGQLGVPTPELPSSRSPQQITFSREMSTLASGGSHSCAVANNGRVYCWGANTYGELGHSWNLQEHEPQLEVPGVTASALALGAKHSCAIVSDRVVCWGDSGSGQIGDGRPGDVLVPPRMVP